MGKVAMSPLPPRGSPPLESGGQDQKWPTSGQSGYITPAVSGIPNASERGGEIQKWPTCGQTSYVTPAVSGIPTASERGGGIQKWPTRGQRAMSPLPSCTSPPLQGKGQNQNWPTCGQTGYVTPAVSGIPTASQRGGKSEVAHKWAKWLRHPYRLGNPHRFKAGGRGNSKVAHLWAKWLRHPCRLGDPHRFRAGGKIRSGPQVGKVATSPLPSRGSPTHQSGGGKLKSGPLVVKLATSPLPSQGSPSLQSGGGGNSEVAHSWAKGYVTPAVLHIPTALEQGAKSEVAHLWANWLRHPCRLGDPHRFRAGGGGFRSGPLVGKVATSPLPSRRSPPLQSGGQDQKWPTSGQSGYITPAVWGIPNASERGGEIQKWPTCGQTSYVTPAVSGIPTASERGGQDQKWPTCGQSGYVTPPASGIPTASQRGGKSERAHKWAKWLRHPYGLGDPHRFRAGGRGIQKWPTCGQSGYVTPAVSGIPTASERGAKSEVAHKWGKWLRHPCRLGEVYVTPTVLGIPTLQSGGGGEFRSGPLVGKVATSPLPPWGSPPLQSGGENQKWPTSGQSGYVTPAVSGIPTASQRGGKSEVAQKWAKWLRHPYRLGDPHRFRAGGRGNSKVAHLWAKWLRHPCRLGDPHRFRAGGKIRSGPQVGKVATSPLPSRGSPTLQSRGQNQKWPTSGQSGYVTSAISEIPTTSERGVGGIQKWPTCGQSGYVTPAALGIPTASEQGAKSEVAHKWAKWLRHP